MTLWMNVEDTMSSEISQTERQILSIFIFMSKGGIKHIKTELTKVVTRDNMEAGNEEMYVCNQEKT